MQEINLLKNQLKDASVVWERRNRLLITSLVAIVILEITAGGLLFLFKQSINKKMQTVINYNTQTQSKLNSKQSELAPAKSFQAQLKNLNYLVDSHLYWTSFFDELGKVTLKKVQYTQLQTDLTGKAYVEGRVNSYSDLGKLLLGLSTSKSFSNVRLLSSNPNSGDASGLNFALDFRVDPELLSKNQ